MNSGSEFMGFENGLVFMKLEAPDTSSGMAVSPIPRAIERISAVARPAEAVGRTTRIVVRHSVPPSAFEASRSPLGTIRSATSLVRAMIGIMVTDIATLTEKPDFGKPSPTTITT